MSSGNLSLDRRLSYAMALLAQGDAGAAADLMADTLTEAPDWVAGWISLGDMAQAAGRTPNAIAAYDRALQLDPRDSHGASLKRDVLTRNRTADKVPSAFVEALFDGYADRFEASLVTSLGYCGPELVLAALGDRSFQSALDIGCGTGLAGAALRSRVKTLEGWDISAAMLRKAARKAIYDQLRKQDLSQLPAPTVTYDLIVAADVFIYLGALGPIVDWVAASLVPGGTFAFTVEACDGTGFDLRQSLRFAHSEPYVQGLLEKAGFTGITLSSAVLRQDRDQPIDALVVVATRP